MVLTKPILQLKGTVSVILGDHACQIHNVVSNAVKHVKKSLDLNNFKPRKRTISSSLLIR